MISEIAITPSLFEEAAQDDRDQWLDQLRKLGNVLFPEFSACPVVISDLYDGSWYPEIKARIDSVTDHTARPLCLDILKGLQNVRVTRKAMGDWPDNDLNWCDEAIAAHEEEPIDRIVTSRAVSVSSEKSAKIRFYDEMLDRGFWHGINASQPTPYSLPAQIGLLRKICFHSQWLALINPYGIASEDKFSKDLIESAFAFNGRSVPLIIELHVASPQNDSEQGKVNLVANFRQRLLGRGRPNIKPGDNVLIHFWNRDFKDRYLLGGGFINETKKRVRWGVAMQHVARESDQDSAPPSEWSLLNNESLSSRFNFFVSDRNSEKPSPIEVMQ